MDYEPDHSYEMPPYRQIEPGQGMLTVSVILGGIALATTCCIYSSLILGSLSIILALLSRGKKKKLSPQGKLAVMTASAAMILSVGLTVGMFAMTVQQYGSMENFIKAYTQIMESLTDMPLTDGTGIQLPDHL